MSDPGRATFDPWEDDWMSAPETAKSQTSGVLVLESKDQVRKLFASEEMQSSNDDDSLRPVAPMKYEVQMNTQGSQYRPQLRILKRTPESAQTSGAPISSSAGDGRPGETEAERMERNRRDKEAKYRAVRESIFGVDNGNNNASNDIINGRSASSSAPRNKEKDSKGRTPRESGRRAAPNSSGKNSPGSTTSHYREGSSSTSNAVPTGHGGIIRVPRGPDGSPGFGSGRIPARKGQ
ncbi:hypothetical protein V1525DRAFT_401328 [Lipomyces kononenkoae]|uniref:Uncharacterized protein n=1 Tax=Lipomyces kononenkoae TaxID=34357 RepID=A0ACC3T357_LIPKO